MKTKDYSEIQETAAIISEIFRGGRQGERPAVTVATEESVFGFASMFDFNDIAALLPSSTISPDGKSLHEQQLEKVLEAMCQRGGFHGAAVASSDGFALASFQTPVDGEALAAFAPSLGQLLDKTALVFNRTGTDRMTIDLDRDDRLVLHRIAIADFSFYLIILCPQKDCVLAEIEAFLERIKLLLK